MSKLFLYFFLLSYSVFSQKKDALYYYNLAEKNSDNGNLRKAYKNYYQAGELSKNYVYYIEAAQAYYLSHNTSKWKHKKKVEELYNKSFILKAWNKEGLLSRADYYLYLANYQGALRNLDSLLVRDSSNIEGYLLKANIYMEKKDTASAFKIYYIAIKKTTKSEWGRIYIDKGSHCYNRGFWKNCIESYSKALELVGPDKFKPYFYCDLSSAYYNIGETSKACYYFKLCEIDKRPTLINREGLLKECK